MPKYDSKLNVHPQVKMDKEDVIHAFDCVDHHKLWKILKEMGIPDHLTCMQVKKQQLEPDMEQWTGSKLGMELYIATLLI